MARSFLAVVVACFVGALALALGAAAQTQDALQGTPAVQLAAAFANTEGTRFPKGRMVEAVMGFYNQGASPRASFPSPLSPLSPPRQPPSRLTRAPVAVIVSAMVGELHSVADYAVVERNVRIIWCFFASPEVGWADLGAAQLRRGGWCCGGALPARGFRHCKL